MDITDTAAVYIGIANANEFYMHHYLSEVFKGDIRQVLEDWNRREGEGGGAFKAPYSRLRALNRDYFTARQRIARERSQSERIARQREFSRSLLEALGYSQKPSTLDLPDGIEIPCLARISQGGGVTLLVLEACVWEGEGDPLSVSPCREQFASVVPPDPGLLKESWNDIITPANLRPGKAAAPGAAGLARPAAPDRPLQMEPEPPVELRLG